MMRLIRMAAVVGMALALVDFCWTAIDAPRNHELVHNKDWHDRKVHWHAALRDQYQPGIGFAVSAILYVLASRAMHDRTASRSVAESDAAPERAAVVVGER